MQVDCAIQAWQLEGLRAWGLHNLHRKGQRPDSRPNLWGGRQERKLVQLLKFPPGITALTEQASVRPALDSQCAAGLLLAHHPYPTAEQETPESPQTMLGVPCNHPEG